MKHIITGAMAVFQKACWVDLEAPPEVWEQERMNLPGYQSPPGRKPPIQRLQSSYDASRMRPGPFFREDK